MASEYFDSTATLVSEGVRAISAHVNNVALAIETGLDKLPTEAQLKQGKVTVGTDTGAANAHIVALPYAPASYADGLEVTFKAAAANTGAATINVNGLGVKSIKRQDGSALVAGDIAASKFITLRYNSTSGFFEIQTNSAALTDVSVRFPNLAGPVTADDTELNKLDGLTASTAELNHSAGVTSAIQTQINNTAGRRGALVYNSANQSVGALAFDSEVYDTDSIHDASTNNGRLTVPSGVSKVRLSASVQAGASASTYIQLLIAPSVASVIGLPAVVVVPVSTGTYTMLNAQSAVLEVSPGDYFTVVTASSLGSENIFGSTSFRTWFAMEIIE